MGKMLETMKQGQGRALLSVAAPQDPAAQPCVTDWEIAEEVPFVEVGGPNKRIEASANVLKHAPQAAPQPPHRPLEKAALPKTVALSSVPAATVEFVPWQDAPRAESISPEVIAFHQPNHAVSKEYEAMLDAMLGALKTEAPSVLLIVGSRPDVGASTVLLNLAAVAATKQELRVAVIETNSGGLTRRLGHAGDTGLCEVLAGALALEHALVKTAIPTLHLLPAGRPAKKLTSGAMTWLIAWLRERFDLVLVDGPSLAAADAAALHVPHADACYLVLPHGESASVGKAVAQTVSAMGGRLCGLIHTHFAS